MAPTFTRILVATDFSRAADAALASGRALATTFGATLHVLHVAENPFLRATVANPHDLETAAWRHLNDRLTEEDRRSLGAVPVMERSDAPADDIVRYARKMNADLIVMGTHGRSGVAHLLRGSVAEQVARAAPCAVLTIREPIVAGKTAHVRRTTAERSAA